jgi:hypothetical protein
LQPKTWRDRLNDLALGLTEIAISAPKNHPSPDQRAMIRAQIDKILQIETGISTWRLSTFSEACPHLQFICDCQYPALLSCICSVPASQFLTNEFAMLQIECWAFQLQASTILKTLVAFEGNILAPCKKHIPLRSSKIACRIEAASTCPTLRHTVDKTNGVTEGFCRTIFPAWALNSYRSTEGYME